MALVVGVVLGDRVQQPGRWRARGVRLGAGEAGLVAVVVEEHGAFLEALPVVAAAGDLVDLLQVVLAGVARQ
jgi:hypothetical protein